MFNLQRLIKEEPRNETFFFQSKKINEFLWEDDPKRCLEQR